MAKYRIVVDTQDDISEYHQKQLARFVLESAPNDVLVTKVEVEDQQTGRKVTMERGEHQ